MDNRVEKRQIGHHILNASSNLLGITFLVITSLRVLHLDENTLIDEITAAAALLFLGSTVLSYLSIRSTGPHARRFEDIADYAFLLGIVGLSATAALLCTGVIS